MSYYGFYNDYLLKSSYEYAYAIYLDTLNINWKYEEISYDFDNARYTPDFFLYEDNELKYIVEIRGDRRRYEDGKESVKKLCDNGINSILLTDKDLRKILKKQGLSLDKIVNEWITSEDTKFNMGMSGEHNPNYGNKHSDKTKYLIGEKSKARWMNPEYRETLEKIIRKNGEKVSKALKGKLRVKRIKRSCINCGKQFSTKENSKSLYCSQLCAANENIKKATEVYVAKMDDIHNNIKNYTIEWCKNNKEVILKTPFNKILTNLHPLFNEIEEKFGIKDLRIISKSICSIESRKEMLLFLKEIASK